MSKEKTDRNQKIYQLYTNPAKRMSLNALSRQFFLGLSDQEITLIVTSLLSFVVVEGGADIMERRTSN